MASVISGGDGPRRRRGGREAKRSGANAIARPFVQPTRHYPPVDLASSEAVEQIHNASLRVLSETGLNVLHDEARMIMKRAGAEVSDGETRVRFEPELISQAMATMPARFTLHARNPHHNLIVGGPQMVFCQMASAPNASCLDRGRRSGNQDDFRNFLRLAQLHPIIHATGGYPVEPVDLHPSIRHLDCISDLITLTDKAYCVYSLGKERIADAIEMTRIAHGLSQDELRRRPSVFTVINTNSPLQLDAPMMQGIIDMASMGQPVVITPFTLSGAMAPVTIPGALVLQNAEALAALAFSQMVCPGAPAVYGGFTSNVDMKSGAPAFGTPEYMKAQHIGGQLARRYKVPYRTSNVCAANTVDAQAAYESVFSLWGAVNSGGHMLKHGAGWMEGGLCCSYEKMILDIDLLQMVAEFMSPMTFDEDELGVDAIADVGPGGHFFGTAHTQARFKDAFYAPILSDWRNFETWREAGEPTAMQKANTVWKQRLAEYEPPALDSAIAEELRAFVEKRKAEGGVPTDF
ncbi:trimethylamine methyltransferase family protein [Hoeflea prorocentri]|uniref:Methyltransferase n=1 Tax=Hoeflea prorocentri TaxID=1922333 RepID=A0A9X3UL98_9HYPH|nr:trimethylamine methyltransferase family protein [Hoeflea prorocentri]MCY6381051.1 trimethylamine methyltransferase family protein [Hoeflea prorocentri]MDA5398851.1 trimethylamine methyltransferase family protein [Hoeflea prorocentri]